MSNSADNRSSFAVARDGFTYIVTVAEGDDNPILFTVNPSGTVGGGATSWATTWARSSVWAVTRAWIRFNGSVEIRRGTAMSMMVWGSGRVRMLLCMCSIRISSVVPERGEPMTKMRRGPRSLDMAGR